MSRPLLLWEPAIYEHKAALIGQSVDAISRSSTLLRQAMEAEYEAYRADYLTVGVDIYNLEAEACGAVVKTLGHEACPEIEKPLWSLESLPHVLTLPDVSRAGRFSVMVETAQRIMPLLGHICRIRVAGSGPASIAAKLVGLEPLVLGLVTDDPAAERVLDFSTALALQWCRRLRAVGLEVILFDSAASPPMFSPSLYDHQILPRHQELMAFLKQSGQTDRVLIMGGDTTAILPQLAGCGATTLLSDYVSNAHRFAELLPSPNRLTIRRNVNPRLFETGGNLAESAAQQFCSDLSAFASTNTNARPIAGTGVLPYRADPVLFQRFRKQVEKIWAHQCIETRSQ